MSRGKFWQVGGGGERLKALESPGRWICRKLGGSGSEGQPARLVGLRDLVAVQVEHLG